MHLTTPMGQLMDPCAQDAKWDARNHARAMPLQGAVKSHQAAAMIDALTEAVLEPINGRAKRIGPSMRSKYRMALGAFLADLMGAAKQGRWGKRSVHTATLSGCPGGRVAFDDVRTGLVYGGLVEEIRGCKKPPREDGYEMENTCSSTIFRPTPALMSLAYEFGIDLDHYRQHFTPSGARPWVPGDALEARAAKSKRKNDKARCLPIDPDDFQARECRERMERLNAYLIDGGRVSGILFGGLRRIFNDADQEGFAWQWGGRFYSMPNWEAYEQLKGKAVKRREAIQIDGQRVAEVDLSAAHLTIYHGLLGAPLDAALYPYDLEGFEVPAVKEWTKKALGAGKPTWGGRKFAPVRNAMLKRYPLLRDLGGNGITTLALQYHESEIILSALEVLRDRHGVASLPIHDGLVVPEVHQVLTQRVLSEAFQAYFRDIIGSEVVPVPRVGLVSYESL